jgi:glycosidase
MNEYHLSRQARQQYALERLTFPDFQKARQIAARMNVSAADLYALGLIDEVLRVLMRHYVSEHPNVLGQAASFLDQTLDPDHVHLTQLTFTNDFPPEAVYRGQVDVEKYLLSKREAVLAELFLLHLHNANPAASQLEELFDDQPLMPTAYAALIERLKTFLAQQPGMGSGRESLTEILTAPLRVSPHSLAGQLEYLIQRWGDLLGPDFVQRLLRGLDFVREEIRRGGTGGASGPAPVLTFERSEIEYERFSPDQEWMPRLVLMAKNTYVWLEQLSRKYGRWIRFLNDIPDEELDILAERGFTGLWLIGLWERSRASQRIKNWLGDPDAVASAYSLHAYEIAADLGGWPALENLRARAWQRGIRLSADMVPNHMGIDSEWVMAHPEWFLSLPYPPFPSYSFTSGDLSDDPRAGIILEDHYYDRTDAAVVFKRFDRATGEERYIYHGNDGTSMPWNDTAQLDYSKAEVREAVIQTILHVARHFPIIRFDAAMTLARKHIQRLWFPEPGQGGAIPSRAEHGMTREQFDAALPNEFWREVVDRVAAEVPDTLLLAEAFWLMEGYFVRTLGMHRVYNSAFMHMLRDEDNAKYRQVMKNVLEFDPQVIKRFVNFMNNPDEKTAVEQFGDGDKYFGVCTLMCTLPGLPMFGHGQIEGYREKYGMEFRKPKWDEQVNEGLVRGHEWRIFPLLHRRRVFAGSENFLLYDFYAPQGYVNEDVFAYSNRLGEERGLVVYHNKYAQASGWVKTSVAFMDKASGKLVQQSLAQGLALPRDGYTIFTDYVTRLEYIRSCRELWDKGLFVGLGAYQCHVFLDWRFVNDENGRWAEVCRVLNGAAIPSVQAKFDEMFAASEAVDVQDTKGKKGSSRKRATSKRTDAQRVRKAKAKKPLAD